MAERTLIERLRLAASSETASQAEAGATLLLAAAAIINPVGDALAERAGAMLLHAVREALDAWHDPVGIVDAGDDVAHAPMRRRRRDRVKPSRADWRPGSPAAASPRRDGRSRTYATIGPTRPQRFDRDRTAAQSGTGPDGRRDALRDRLLSVIGNAIGPDRQCHLTVAVIAARACAAPERTRKELSAMVKAGLISRFAHVNGQTATMIVTPAPASPAPGGFPPTRNTPPEGDMH